MALARPADSFEIDVTLVQRLIADQFPALRDLPIEPVLPGGWDNRTFRLGDALSVRLPSSAAYAAQAGKEAAWLPRLASHLPVSIPEIVGLGRPTKAFPYAWSIRRWIDGVSLNPDAALSPRLAAELARTLAALHRIDPAGGPVAGVHSFHRGGDLGAYDSETARALERLEGQVQVASLRAIWAAARATRWQRPGVFVHGDVAPGNLLVRDGALAAIIDFGQLAVGDPACDLAIGWTSMDAATRADFLSATGLDADTTARGRGWALWKAAIVAAGLPGTDPKNRDRAMLTLAAITGDTDTP
jgi:aminoglycoside phosphotransferase (APT) family kinase protein